MLVEGLCATTVSLLVHEVLCHAVCVPHVYTIWHGVCVRVHTVHAPHARLMCVLQRTRGRYSLYGLLGMCSSELTLNSPSVP